MGHSISAIIAEAPCCRETAARFDLSLIESGGHIVIPLFAGHADFWTEKLELNESETGAMILDCAVTHYFARELLGERIYALIETDYFGGHGSQSAAVYQGGMRLFAEWSTEIGPINRALKMIGVFTRHGKDEFDTLGLGKYQSFDELFRKYWS